MPEESVADLAVRIDNLLPQTQCTRCGFGGCKPYAEAIAGGVAPINQCPPGGQATIDALAGLLARPTLALNPAHGVETLPQVAFIDEERCIGCARCLAPCPVDAIVGAAKYMHTIIAERCTGCELCLAPCPVDCIEMRPSAFAATNPAVNRARFWSHTVRLANRESHRQRVLDAKKAAARRPAGG